ncbi:MAG: galactokinase [Candidatus Marinimicrobia bacterium]|nr:galactokinase [Candidatus Neomarinimicrobiota bacterium]
MKGNIFDLVDKIKFENLYENQNDSIKRYELLYRKFKDTFDLNPDYVFSSPGRTELGGNHTDHNNGKVIAGTINLDIIAFVKKTDDNEIIVYSEMYDEPFIVRIDQTQFNESEKETSTALIRGIVKRFLDYGYNTRGFKAYISSNIPSGTGLSTSAAFEVLIGEILNILYNYGKVDKSTIAIIGKYAENNYFGKPCGLMDQLTIAIGGIINIDFKEIEKPIVKSINYNFKNKGYELLLIDTGGTHADLSKEYALIPSEMTNVANYFNKTSMRDVRIDDIIENINGIRKVTGDRAILRSLHYLQENDRVDRMVEALENDRFDEYLELINQSGNSSFKYLQNCYLDYKPEEQPISIALCLTEAFLNRIGVGACRIHGGGFAGTIQVYIPIEAVKEYKNFIGKCFGNYSVIPIEIRKDGVAILNR